MAKIRFNLMWVYIFFSAFFVGYLLALEMMATYHNNHSDNPIVGSVIRSDFVAGRWVEIKHKNGTIESCSFCETTWQGFSCQECYVISNYSRD